MKNLLKNLRNQLKTKDYFKPIIVSNPKENYYEIVAGERRWRASQLAGLHEIECVIKDFDNDKIFESALIENIQREDLNVIEEAKAYKILIEKNNFTNETLSKKLVKAQVMFQIF